MGTAPENRNSVFSVNVKKGGHAGRHSAGRWALTSPPSSLGFIHGSPSTCVRLPVNKKSKDKTWKVFLAPSILDSYTLSKLARNGNGCQEQKSDGPWLKYGQGHHGRKLKSFSPLIYQLQEKKTTTVFLWQSRKGTRSGIAFITFIFSCLTISCCLTLTQSRRC